jgi:hypothetical protein
MPEKMGGRLFKAFLLPEVMLGVKNIYSKYRNHFDHGFKHRKLRRLIWLSVLAEATEEAARPGTVVKVAAVRQATAFVRPVV